MPGAIYAQGTEVSLWNNVTARNVGDTLTIRLGGEHRGREDGHHQRRASPRSAELTGPDDRRPAGHGEWRARSSKASMDNESQFAGNGASDAEQQTRRLHHRDRGQALLQRQPAGARPEVDRDQLRHANSCACRASCVPSDIAPDNRVVSWQVADAYISYGGQGTVANASKPGWLYRFFNSPQDAVLSEGLHMRRRLRTPASNHSTVRRHLRRVVPARSPSTAQAERVKDLASVQGVRSNQLVGYGLVVGLDGTGDQTSQAPFTHPEHQEHADPLRRHHSAEHQSAAQERGRGDRARGTAAVRQARPEHRHHRVVDRQRRIAARR